MKRAWLLPLGLLTACLGTQKVSLGELLVDAAPADETVPPPKTPAESRDIDAPRGHDDDEETRPERDEGEPEPEPSRDAGVLDASGRGAADAASSDAVDAAEVRDSGAVSDASGPLNDASDASRASDASARGEDAGRDAESDAARADGGDAGDGSVPLICQIEPWHCW